MGITTWSLSGTKFLRLGAGFEPGILDFGCSFFCLEVLVNVGKVDKKLDNPFESDLLCEFTEKIRFKRICHRMYLQMLDWNEFYIAFKYTQCGGFPRGFPTKHFI